MSIKTKRDPVAQLTYYVVQSYKVVKGRRGGISADEPVPARDHDHAMRIFERLKAIRAGVVAFHRTGSPATGEFDDAVIIARHGILPSEIDGLVDLSAPDFESWDLSDADLKVA